MFEALSEKLQRVFQRLGSRGRLTEKDVDEALREVRLALLEADVHFKVVRDFVARVKESALGEEVLASLTPAQQVIKIVHAELTSLLGGGQSRLASSPTPPTAVMLAGLQGSGKTTTAAKLAQHLLHSGQRSLLVAADFRRPAAVEQLAVLGQQVGIPVYQGKDTAASALAQGALKRAREVAAQWLLIDTGGRLHIDEALMKELVALKDAFHPVEILLVADAMTGQDAVRSAQEFHSRIGLTGLILTKMDGDARGGAALSMKAIADVPIKFVGTGEKADALELFHPERMASRILGMGDVLTLIEKAEATFTQEQAKKLEQKMRSATLDLNDFLDQLRQLKKMGPLSQILDMIPGFSAVNRQLPQAEVDDKQMKKVEAIILSMTPAERRHPNIIDGSRRRRIARGSGTTPQDINRLLNQFSQMQKLMKQMGRGRGPLALFR